MILKLKSVVVLEIVDGLSVYSRSRSFPCCYHVKSVLAVIALCI